MIENIHNKRVMHSIFLRAKSIARSCARDGSKKFMNQFIMDLGKILYPLKNIHTQFYGFYFMISIEKMLFGKCFRMKKMWPRLKEFGCRGYKA